MTNSTKFSTQVYIFKLKFLAAKLQLLFIKAFADFYLGQQYRKALAYYVVPSPSLSIVTFIKRS